MMIRKKTSAVVLSIALAFAPALPAVAAEQTIKVEYNQQQIAFPDQQPILKDNRTLVPIRPIAESLGFHVEWNEESRTVMIKKGSDQIRLVVSQKIARKNTETLSLDVPSQIVNQRTMVPVRFVAEALQYNVNWDQERQTVMISDLPADTAATQPAEQPVEPAVPAPQPEEEQPTEQVVLVDPESITATNFNMMGLGIYVVKGEVDPDAEVTITLDNRNFDAKVDEDGTFILELMDKFFVSEYKLTATKDGKEQVIEGEFTEKKR